MDKWKILATGRLHHLVIEDLKKRTELIFSYHPDCSRHEIMDEIAEADILITRSETKVDQELLNQARKLKFIARAAVGVANIDLEAATEKGILVFNCPGLNTNAAAELSFAHILNMYRHLPQAFMHMKKGYWDRDKFCGKELRGKRLGILGLGHVGYRVAKFAKGFDMQVFAYDPYISQERFSSGGVQSFESLEEIISCSDILTIHVPLNKETRKMLDARLLSLLPKGSYLVNAARGGVVCEQALLDALETKHLSGVAIDTWQDEPEPRKDLIQHPLVFTSPHIGASTQEAQTAVGLCLLQQINKALKGQHVDHPVNLPQLGVVEDPFLLSYTLLAEKLGSFAAQILPSQAKKTYIWYRGKLANAQHEPIKRAWMKGFASGRVDSFVSHVNADRIFASLGIECCDQSDPDFDRYPSALKFVVECENNKEVSLGGFAFDPSFLRISMINSNPIEMEAWGQLLLVKNQDKPGVIGEIGRLLAQAGINIDSFKLNRSQTSSWALALIRCDTFVSQKVLNDLLKNKAVIEAYSISL